MKAQPVYPLFALLVGAMLVAACGSGPAASGPWHEEQVPTNLKTGRSTSDPANTTGVDMPPKGGNPALTDQDLLDIIAYIRTLEK